MCGRYLDGLGREGAGLVQLYDIKLTLGVAVSPVLVLLEDAVAVHQGGSGAHARNDLRTGHDSPDAPQTHHWEMVKNLL